jgi:hypothetical protein
LRLHSHATNIPDATPQAAKYVYPNSESSLMPEQKYDLLDRIDRDFKYHVPKHGQPER